MILSSVKKLIEQDRCLKLGNHSCKANGTMRYFYYFNTAICSVNHNAKSFIVNDDGYKTSSTKRAINSYIEYFKILGYDMIDQRKE